jgi:hypothetical protein
VSNFVSSDAGELLFVHQFDQGRAEFDDGFVSIPEALRVSSRLWTDESVDFLARKLEETAGLGDCSFNSWERLGAYPELDAGLATCFAFGFFGLFWQPSW